MHQRAQLVMFSFSRLGEGMRVLDVGCGSGREMIRVRERGCRPFGIDIAPTCVEQCRSLALPVVQAGAERLPFADAVFDGAVCQVVIPLTDERCTLAEIARVLRPGGILYLSCHGSGYYLEQALLSPFRIWLYALRALVNTWFFVATGRRLPGFLGDTAYQSRRRLGKYFGDFGLRLVEELPPQRFLGRPVFFSFTLEKRPLVTS